VDLRWELDSTRAAILTLSQRNELKSGHDNVRLDRFRKRADDCREFYNINREIQIQSLVVSIPAYETLIDIGH
jgi:hypothetical protein